MLKNRLHFAKTIGNTLTDALSEQLLLKLTMLPHTQFKLTVSGNLCMMYGLYPAFPESGLSPTTRAYSNS